MVTNATNSTTNTTSADGVAIVFPSNPFVGLRPFNSGEALLFFGRGEQTVELLRRLHRNHFIAVVGSSGCGKSSLVRAGLIPKLRAGFLAEDRDQWLVAAMKPGDAPLRNLAAALIEAIPAGGDVEVCAEAIRAGGAQAVVEQLSPSLAHSDANLLLLVDQFEEIFRFGVEPGRPERQAEAEDFVSIMLALAEQRRLPIYVVMTMRSDFLGDCDHFHGLPEAMNRGQYLVPRLTRQQRRQAIEGPILLFGASISPRFLDRLLNDVGDKSDQLPVMQHSLMRTWEEWHFEMAHGGRSEIDIEHYEAVGGIKNALSKDAEAALAGMSEEDLKTTERMFQALTDTDANQRRVRRPARLSEIAAVTSAAREKICGIVEKFRGEGRSFLTLTGDADPLIDISHESLIRQWKKLEDWVDKEAESRTVWLRLSDAARRRQANRASLWSGIDLKLALEWRKNNRLNQAWARRYDSDFGTVMLFLKLSQRKERRDRLLKYLALGLMLLGLVGGPAYIQHQRRIQREQELDRLKLFQTLQLDQERQKREFDLIQQRREQESELAKKEQEFIKERHYQERQLRLIAEGALRKLKQEQDAKEKAQKRLNEIAAEVREDSNREMDLVEGKDVTYSHPVVGIVRYRLPQGGRLEFLDNWVERNIITIEIPELRGVPGARPERFSFYKAAAPQLLAAFKEARERNLLNVVESWAGPAYLSRNHSQLYSSRPSAYSLGIAFRIATNRPRSLLVFTRETEETEAELEAEREFKQVFEKHGFSVRDSDPAETTHFFFFEVIRIATPARLN